MTSMRKTRSFGSSEVGSKIKMIRNGQKLKLAELAERSSLPVSTISKLENGKAALTYEKMMILASALNVDIGELLANQAEASPSQMVTGRRSISRKGEGVAVNSGSYERIHLATDVLNKKFVPMIGIHHARSLEEFGPLNHHPGEEFIYIISGTLELHTELYAPTVLETGDTMYFDSGMGHAYISASEEPCVVLSVCLPQSNG